MPADCILFVSREPVTRERNGSTAAVANLLQLLCAHGASVTVLVTTSASRSPRLVFRSTLALPAGCTLRVPGYLRLGSWFVRPWSPLAWARLIARALHRIPALQSRILAASSGRLFTNSWDLTEPTARERQLVHLELARTRPATLLANYAFWGPLLRDTRGVHRAILLHDLLADHVRLFQQAGLPLDCNPISESVEMQWLRGADTLIAVQRDEAESVRRRLHGTASPLVLVQPISVPVRLASPAPHPLHCLLVASNSTPNLQGLQWLLHSVWPLVLAAEPRATLAVAGTVRDRWTGPLPAGVTLLGSVDSLADHHSRASVCLVPLLVGSGLKIKLLEALSYGKATVSTTIGVQGLQDWATDTIAVADTPSTFAAEVLRLLHDPRLRQQREAAATALVERHFSTGSPAEHALLSRLLPHFSGIGHMAPPAPHKAFTPRDMPIAVAAPSVCS